MTFSACVPRFVLRRLCSSPVQTMQHYFLPNSNVNDIETKQNKASILAFLNIKAKRTWLIQKMLKIEAKRTLLIQELTKIEAKRPVLFPDIRKIEAKPALLIPCNRKITANRTLLIQEL
jgi:hypothetical protein